MLLTAQMVESSAELFVLIDLDSGNVVSDSDAIDDALASIRRAADSHGRAAVERLSLMFVCGEDQRLVAMKETLVDLARTQDLIATPVGR